MSAEYRQWENEVEQLLKPFGMDLGNVPDEVIGNMYMVDLTVEEAVQLIINEMKYYDKQSLPHANNKSHDKSNTS